MIERNIIFSLFLSQKSPFIVIGTLKLSIISTLQISKSWGMEEMVGSTKEFSVGYFPIGIADRYHSTDTGSVVVIISTQLVLKRSAQVNQVWFSTFSNFMIFANDSFISNFLGCYFNK